MAIMSKRPSEDTVDTQAAKPTITSKYIEPNVIPHRTSTLIDSETPFNKMASDFLSGAKWSVEYYNQIKAEDDIVAPLDPSAPDSLASYTLFDNLTLYVDSFIDPTAVNIEGEAKVVGITPNQGDLFKAELAGARQALLRVEEVNKLSYDLNDGFTITYKLDSFLDKDDTRYRRLKAKTVKEFIEDIHYSDLNNGKILLKNDYNQVRNLKGSIDNIIDEFLEVSINDEYNIITVPDLSGKVVHDPYHSKFFYSIVDISDHPRLLNLNRLGIPFESSYTLWDGLLDMDIQLFKRKLSTEAKVDLTASTRLLLSKEIGHIGIDSMVFPDNALTSTDKEMLSGIGVGVALGTVSPSFNGVSRRYSPWRYIRKDRFYDNDTSITATNIDGLPVYVEPTDGTMTGTPVPTDGTDTTINPNEIATPNLADIPLNDNINLNMERFPTLNGDYVFNKTFISTSGNNLSSFETLVISYLEHRLLNKELLFDLIDSYYEWDDLHKYLYLPILILLVKYHVSTIKTSEIYKVNKY